MRRKDVFTEGEYYHVFNRGVEKRTIFIDETDRWRFLTLLIVSQGQLNFSHISRAVTDVKRLRFNKPVFQEIIQHPIVKLTSFCLMPNHFHCLLKEMHKGGISKYMQRIGDSFTKYFNKRRQRSGHLFGSAFKSIHVDTNDYLNYLSAYIHLNPKDLSAWRGKEISYRWSSYQDYVYISRWGKFLDPSIILDQFKNRGEYKNFVESCEPEDELDANYLIDSRD